MAEEVTPMIKQYLATKADIKVGSTHKEKSLFVDLNSSKKKAAVSGVPNNAAKTALIPPIVKTIRSSSFKRKTLADADATDPPNCNAAPSLPAEPPKRCVIAVETKMSGATTGLTAFCSFTHRMTVFVPPNSFVR